MVPLSPIGSQEMIRIVTAHKRRFGQGNILHLSVSHSVHGGRCIPVCNGQVVCVSQHGMGWGVCVCYKGDMWPWGFDQGCVLPGDVTGGM